MVVGAFDSRVLWAVIDVLPLRGSAQFAYRVLDAVRADAHNLTGRHHSAQSHGSDESHSCDRLIA